MKDAPFFSRLRAYFQQLGRVLEGQATLASVFPNASDVGSAREHVYAEVLRRHLPIGCNLSLGGFLFGADGSESRQVDIIITVDRALQFRLSVAGAGKSFAPVDGCIGVVSVKSHLTSARLREALENLASIPQQMPSAGRINTHYRFDGYEDWPYKVIYASSGIASERALKAVHDFYAERPEIPETRRPHVIHVVGSYMIGRLRLDIGREDGQVILRKGDFGVLTKDVDPQALMLVLKNLQQNAQDATQVIFGYAHILEHMTKWEPASDSE